MSDEIILENSISTVSINLNIPNPPEGLRYKDFEDFRHKEILKANGIALDEESLLEAARKQQGVLQAAAVHTLGSMGVTKAEALFKELLKGLDDTVRAEAAYALHLFGVAEGKEDLIKCLDMPMEAYLCPPLAAGYLARIGDPRGYEVIKAALDMDFMANKMTACKQLLFFIPFDGKSGSDGTVYDITALFQKALSDSSESIQWQALVQLEEAAPPACKAILEQYIQNSSNQGLKQKAAGILEQL